MKNNQKGFSAVELTVVLAIIVLLGIVGFYVWSSNSKSKKPSALPATSPSSASVDYLTIKELGIKFKLSDKIKDAYYYVNKDGAVYLSVHQYDGKKGFERCTAKGSSDEDGSGLASVIVGQVGGNNGTPSGGTWTQQELGQSGLVKLGDKYYGFEGNYQATCIDLSIVPDTDGQSRQMNLALIQAFTDQQSTITKL